MNLLLNMNLPRQLGSLLSELGHDCQHVGDLGMSSSGDEEIIRYAKSNGQIILTHDLDYGDLLAFSGEQRPSVIIFRLRDVSIENLKRRFEDVWPQVNEHLSQGAVVTIADQAVRIRRLPIRQD